MDAHAFSAHVMCEPNSGCWLWTGYADRQGYGHVYLAEQRRHLMAHRISWGIFRGVVPLGLSVLHKCDTPSCVNPDHLFLGTHTDNMRDMVAKGRGKPPRLRGELNASVKLTESLVRAILANPKSHRKIAAEYGIAHATVGAIKRGENWPHIERVQ